MRRKLAALLLAACLTLTLSAPALAVEPESAFPVTTEYPGFSDVAEGSWSYPSIKICCETGLMQGTGTGFNPSGELHLSEVIAVSARLSSALTGDPIPAAESGEPWYAGAVRYLKPLAEAAGNTTASSLLSQPTQTASRYSFLHLLAMVVPASHLTPINSITSIPDSTDAAVLTFYNAGILTGVNSYGTFSPWLTLTREQMAAMVARIVRPELRQTFTPAPPAADDPAFDPVAYMTGLPGSAIYFSAGGVTITLAEYLYFLADAMDYMAELSQLQGIALNWDNTIGDRTLAEYAAANANYDAFHYAWLRQMVPDPQLSQEEQEALEDEFSSGYSLSCGASAQVYRDVQLSDARLAQLLAANHDVEAEFDAFVAQAQADLKQPQSKGDGYHGTRVVTCYTALCSLRDALGG